MARPMTVVTRASVATTVTNGDFASAVGWTLAATSGQTSTISGGQAQRSRPERMAARQRALRSVTVAGGDVNVEHALRIVVDARAGGVPLRLDLAAATNTSPKPNCAPGDHSLALHADRHVSTCILKANCRSSRSGRFDPSRGGRRHVAADDPWITRRSRPGTRRAIARCDVLRRGWLPSAEDRAARRHVMVGLRL
jgi:hypothetical protein